MVIEKVVDEMRSKPFTMLMILGLYGGGVLMWQQQSSFAGQEQVQAINSRLTGLEEQALENRLGAIEAELFDRLQKISELNNAHKPVDPIYYDNIKKLQNEKETIERKLAGYK